MIGISSTHLVVVFPTYRAADLHGTRYKRMAKMRLQSDIATHRIIMLEIQKSRIAETVSSLQALRTMTLKAMHNLEGLYTIFIPLSGHASQKWKFDRSGLRSYLNFSPSSAYSGLAYNILD